MKKGAEKRNDALETVRQCGEYDAEDNQQDLEGVAFFLRRIRRTQLMELAMIGYLIGMDFTWPRFCGLLAVLTVCWLIYERNR